MIITIIERDFRLDAVPVVVGGDRLLRIVVDGNPDYFREFTDEVDVETPEEAADLIKSRGLTFSATGNEWAASPDGSFTVDYRQGIEREVTAHFRWQDWSPQDIARVVELVG